MAYLIKEALHETFLSTKLLNIIDKKKAPTEKEGKEQSAVSSLVSRNFSKGKHWPG